MSRFLHALLYLGDKDSKTVAAPRAITFQRGPDYSEPYAYVSEEEGVALVKRFPSLFAFAPAREAARLDALESRIEALEKAAGGARRAQKPPYTHEKGKLNDE